MKKTLFIVLTLLAALLVCVSCDNSLDADVFTPDPTPETDPNKMPLTLEFIEAGELTITISDLSDDYGEAEKRLSIVLLFLLPLAIKLRFTEHSKVQKHLILLIFQLDAQKTAMFTAM